MLILPDQFFRSRCRWSGSKPNFFWSSFSGADAPNDFMPIMRPRFPMYRPIRTSTPAPPQARRDMWWKNPKYRNELHLYMCSTYVDNEHIHGDLLARILSTGKTIAFAVITPLLPFCSPVLLETCAGGLSLLLAPAASQSPQTTVVFP
jgi:hypothetical protein